MKHSGSLSGDFPLSNGVKQGCVLAPTLFSIFFSIVLREAKEDLQDGIYIRFRTDGSLFNLRRLLKRTKTIEELITELLFADDCAVLANTEEALQHIVNCLSGATKNFGLTISLKKTEVLYQPPLREAYSPPHISIEGTGHFTYPGSVISNDATVSKALDNRLSNPSQQFLWKTVKESTAKSLTLPLHKDPGIQGPHRSHPAVWCRDLGSLLEADQATGMVLPMLLALQSWHQMARPHVRRRSPKESQPAQHKVHLASDTAALGWPSCQKDGRCTHAQSSLLQ